MRKVVNFVLVLGLLTLARPAFTADISSDTNQPPRVPAFSTAYMDRSVNPSDDFYHFADGQWLKNNPVPADKSRWASFSELAERNWYLIHSILNDAEAQGSALPAHSPRREVGDFFASIMDTNQIENLAIMPIAGDLKKINDIQSAQDFFAVLADFHQRDIDGLFGVGFGPDAKDSSIYAVELEQSGLSLPDRDYYLKDTFADKLGKYREHVTKMFTLFERIARRRGGPRRYCHFSGDRTGQGQPESR